VDETASIVSYLTGIRTENIRSSYTHTHSGPNVYRLDVISQGQGTVLKYLEELLQRIAGAVWQAQQDMRPVRFAAATGLFEMNVNRRVKLPDGRLVVGKNFSGPADHTVRVVRPTTSMMTPSRQLFTTCVILRSWVGHTNSPSGDVKLVDAGPGTAAPLENLVDDPMHPVPMLGGGCCSA
jgi:hypothetical protein